MSLGAADFAASMGMQTTGIGGTQAGYYMLPPKDGDAPRPPHYRDPWHGVTAAIVAACRANGLLPVDGPFGDFSDRDGFVAQARRAATLGMVGKWAIHPARSALANEVFTPGEAQVAEAREIVAAMREAEARGQGAATYKGRLIDIASVRQARVIVEMAELIGRPLSGGRRTSDRRPVAIPRTAGSIFHASLRERRMQTYLDFEKGLAEIEGKAEELRTLARKNAEMNVEDEAVGARPQGRDAARRPLPQPRSLAEDAGRAPPRPAALQGLHRGAVPRMDAARRRPQLCRRPRDHGRPRPLQRPARGGDRPREGQRHPRAHRPQLRHGPPRGLSQGDPADGSRRPLRPAGHHPGRHARRLSRQGCRGARPGRGDRPLDREVPAGRRADRLA